LKVSGQTFDPLVTLVITAVTARPSFIEDEDDKQICFIEARKESDNFKKSFEDITSIPLSTYHRCFKTAIIIKTVWIYKT
jgi:hypothetical protein